MVQENLLGLNESIEAWVVGLCGTRIMKRSTFHGKCGEHMPLLLLDSLFFIGSSGGFLDNSENTKEYAEVCRTIKREQTDLLFVDLYEELINLEVFLWSFKNT